MILEEPRFSKEGWEYFDEETEQWKLKPDAPDWARKEFEEFYSQVNPSPDEDGVVKQY